MTANVQVGSILIDDRPQITQALGFKNEYYSGTWNLVKGFDAFSLDRKIHAAGWNFFFMVSEVKVMALGGIGPGNIQRALKRVLGKVKQSNFNCLEVTEIAAKRFLGVPYMTVSVHSRHIQQSCALDSAQERRATQKDAEWARS